MASPFLIIQDFISNKYCEELVERFKVKTPNANTDGRPVKLERTIYANEGQYITARFSVPHYGQDDSFDLENYIRGGFIRRIEHINPFMRKIAIQFAQSLPFKPGEQNQSVPQPEAVEA